MSEIHVQLLEAHIADLERQVHDLRLQITENHNAHVRQVAELQAVIGEVRYVARNSDDDSPTQDHIWNILRDVPSDVLDAALADAKADGWDEGYRRGMHPWTGREGEVDPIPTYIGPPSFGKNANPYRKGQGS